MPHSLLTYKSLWGSEVYWNGAFSPQVAGSLDFTMPVALMQSLLAWGWVMAHVTKMIIPHRWVGYTRAHRLIWLKVPGITLTHLQTTILFFSAPNICVCVCLSQKLPGWTGGEKPSFSVGCPHFLGHFLTFSHHYRHPVVPATRECQCAWEGVSTEWGQAKIISAAWRCGVERPCVGVAGKAQQSCGFARKPTPGMWGLLGHVKLTLEGRESWSMTPVLVSSLWSQEYEPSFCHRPHTLWFTLCLFAAAVVTSVALWIAFLAAFLLPFLFSVPPPVSFSVAFCPVGPLIVRFCN